MFNVITYEVSDNKKADFKLAVGKKTASGKELSYNIKSIEITSKDKTTKVIDNSKLGKYKLNLDIDDLRILNGVSTQMFSGTQTTELNLECFKDSVFFIQAETDVTFDEIISLTFLIEYSELKKWML